MQQNITRSSLFAVGLLALGMASSGQVSAYSFHTLYSFCKDSCLDGAFAAGDPLLDNSGNLYGTTYDGGKGFYQGGTVFELVPDGHKWKHHVLYSFCKDMTCSDGAEPWTGVIVDIAGNLYGTTEDGGAFNGGTVFELQRPADGGKWKHKLLYSFAEQSYPNSLTYAGAAMGAPYDGTSPLYGTATSGGEYNGGTAFELERNPNTGKFKEITIHQFCMNCTTDGGDPEAGMIMDAAGNLFGATRFDGMYTDGVVYELSPHNKTWKERIVHSFSSGEGGEPRANLTLDSEGNIFGTTSQGGGGNGTIFELVRSGENFTYGLLHTFNGEDGYDPFDVHLDSAGNLFGAALSNFGTGGTIFELSGNNFRVLYTLSAGGPPYADGIAASGVVIDGSGNLFGVTSQFGKYNGGNVYELKH